MKDFPVARFVERREIVAIVPEPQSGDAAHERTVKLAFFEAQIIPEDVLAHVRALGDSLPRKSIAQPFASGRGS
jgi:hypothetical protein